MKISETDADKVLTDNALRFAATGEASVPYAARYAAIILKSRMAFLACCLQGNGDRTLTTGVQKDPDFECKSLAI